MPLCAKFRCDTRDYTSWRLFDVSCLEELPKITYSRLTKPIEHKIFDQDIIKLNDNGEFVEILHSSNRAMTVLPGVMQFDKMFGKIGKQNKYYFRVIPDDRRLPEFLVPYKIKKIGFAKTMKQKYVIFKYKHWNTKHPIGELVETIGDVDILNNFYEYQLYCKSLYASIQLITKKAINALKTTSEDEYIDRIMRENYYKIEDRTEDEVICIDPIGSKDFDDGFSIQFLNTDKTKIKLSIHIANVAIWLDVLDLWSSFSKRIATIYLPDRKRPMLPSLLSDSLCSLHQNQRRFAFTMDIIIENHDIIKYSFHNTLIKVKRNYIYDENKLLSDKVYLSTLDCLTRLKGAIKNAYNDEIIDSHDVITQLMLLMNYYSALEFEKFKNGIFRSIKFNVQECIPETIPKSVIIFLKGWNSTGGEYCIYSDKYEHQFLKMNSYVHITSPIRRLVDILNMMQLQINLGLFQKNYEANQFFEKWINSESLLYINTSMRAIRKLQNSCELLDLCVKHPEVMDKKYDGYVFDKIQRNDGMYQYMVYLPEIKLLNKYVTRKEYPNYTCNKYSLYLFKNEANFKQKIMLGFDDI